MNGFSLHSLVEHADLVRFGLLTLLILLSRGRFIRVVLALYAGFELGHGIATGAGPTVIIWSSILLGLAVLMLLISVIVNAGARLSAEEQAMHTRLLGGIGRGRARHFIDQGYWLNGASGEVLLREGEPVQQLCYLASGEAHVMMAGRAIGTCRSSDVVGGMAFFTGETAAATVALAGRARFWVAPAERLNPYFHAHPDIRRAIERSIGEASPADEDQPFSNEGRPAISAA